MLAAFVAALLLAPAASTPAVPTSPRHALRPFDGSLSVLTYNVKGLPWPIALGRPEALGRIADGLARLRDDGRAPHVVVLQEAFTDAARQVASRAGYRYVVDGPGADTPGESDAAVARDYAAAARWWNGETEGKFAGSGLQIASDYPIVAVRMIAFPAAACAGYDCLANKGAVLASIQVPGIAEPVDVLAAHLNSRSASGVAKARADRAYAMQTAALAAFVARAHDPRRMLVAAGDFNMGKTRGRRSTLVRSVRNWTSAPVYEALQSAHRFNLLSGHDAHWELFRGKDFQFFSPGAETALSLQSIDAPFGRDAAGEMLSDHVGWVARFAVVPRPQVVLAQANTDRTSRRRMPV